MAGEEDPADLMTKVLQTKEVVDRCRRMIIEVVGKAVEDICDRGGL